MSSTPAAGPSAFVRPRRFILYARLSLVSSEESVSIARQLEAGRQYVAARGGVVVREEFDDGVSATRHAPEDRQGWKRVLAAAADADAVVVWKVDRLARRVIDFLHADAALQALGAGLVAVEDPVDMTTPQGRAFATLLAVFGEMEAAAISARSTAARSHMIAEGRTVGGRRPWPYEAVPTTSGPGVEWRPVPERAEAIRWAAQEMIAGTTSIRKIGREWEARGVMPWGGGEHWERTSILRTLRNPVLAGATMNHGKPVRNPDQTMRISPERVILDLATWRRLQDALDARAVVRDPITQRAPSLLGGLLHCASCGRNMYQNRTSRPKPYYICPNDHCAAHAVVTSTIVEPIAERAFLETFGDMPVVEGRAPEPERADPEEIAAVADALEDVELALASPDVDDDEGLRLIRSRRDLAVRLAELRDAAAAAAGPRSLVVLRDSGETYGERYAAADVEGRAALLASVWTAIEVKPGRRGVRKQPEDRFVFVDAVEPV